MRIFRTLSFLQRRESLMHGSLFPSLTQLGFIRSFIGNLNVKIPEAHWAAYSIFYLWQSRVAERILQTLFLVIIRVIYSFHKHFSVIYFIGKCFGYKLRQNLIINCAYNHGIHVIFFTDFAPIHTFFKFFFQY